MQAAELDLDARCDELNVPRGRDVASGRIEVRQGGHPHTVANPAPLAQFSATARPAEAPADPKFVRSGASCAIDRESGDVTIGRFPLRDAKAEQTSNPVQAEPQGIATRRGVPGPDFDHREA